MRKYAAICFLIAGLCGAAPVPAFAESPIGKTIAWTVRICAEGTPICLPAPKLQVYVSTARRVFDYSGSEKGTIAPLGQWVTVGGKRRRFTLRGDTLIAETFEGQAQLRGALRVAGNTCSAGYDAKVVGMDQKFVVELLSCEVRQGSQPY